MILFLRERSNRVSHRRTGFSRWNPARRERRSRYSTGFTIVEMLTVFAILAIIGLALSIMVKQVVASYLRIKIEQDIHDTSRTLVQTLTRDIENAFISATDNRFIFRGTNTTLDFNALLALSEGGPETVEVGYVRTAEDRVMRRLETGSAIPNDISSGGTADIIAEGVRSLSFRFGYRDDVGEIQYASAGVPWDSAVERFTNYTISGIQKDPDGLPDVIEVSFSVTDATETAQPRAVTTHIFLPHKI